MGQDITSLLNLPIETLAILGGGYVAYRIAYLGRKSGHSATDTIMIALFFGLLVKGVMAVSSALNFSVEVAIPSALVITWIAASLWRVFVENFIRDVLSWMKVSNHDGQPDVLSSVIARTDLKGPTRVIVKLDDGTNLMSDNLSQFDKAPMGAVLFGEDGSIALYVTDICKPGTSEWVAQNPCSEAYGYLMTFIPAARIRLIEVQRHS